jgi:hypothetical protein
MVPLTLVEKLPVLVEDVVLIMVPPMSVTDEEDFEEADVEFSEPIELLPSLIEPDFRDEEDECVGLVVEDVWVIVVVGVK